MYQIARMYQTAHHISMRMRVLCFFSQLPVPLVLMGLNSHARIMAVPVHIWFQQFV
jgi:hypothetical protein